MHEENSNDTQVWRGTDLVEFTRKLKSLQVEMVILEKIVILSRLQRNICKSLSNQLRNMSSTSNVESNNDANHEENKCKEPFVIDKSAFTIVKENTTEIFFPNSQEVFYNPVQELNRDISVACIRQFVKELEDVDEDSKSKHCKLDGGVKVLEALAASGLRSIRYANEISGIANIIANDIGKEAFESISRNVAFNKVDHLVTPNLDDAAMYMYQHKNSFQVVDIDPYGSPSIFLDAAVQSVFDGGILLVTCTDMAVLCGNGSEACHSKYGSMSLRSKNCHEMALRIVLRCIESHANRYGRYIVPLLSLSVDFYVRLIVKVYTSPINVKKSASKLALVYMCNGCETFNLQPVGKSVQRGENKNTMKHTPAVGPTIDSKCHHCGSSHQLGGPIWASSLHDQEYVSKVLKSIKEKPEDFQTSKRLIGLLNIVLEELNDVPLYYILDRLSAICHSTCPKMMQVRSAILNANYRVSYSHAMSTSIKTDAPPEFMWDIMRTWVLQNPIKKSLTDSDPAKKILSKTPRNEVSFELHSDCNPESRKSGISRFPLNPDKFWGPKSRAKSSLRKDAPNEKSLRNQNKRSIHTQSDDNTFKKYQCKRFKQGKCELGDKCRYTHCLSAEGDVLTNENRQSKMEIAE